MVWAHAEDMPLSEAENPEQEVMDSQNSRLVSIATAPEHFREILGFEMPSLNLHWEMPGAQIRAVVCTTSGSASWTLLFPSLGGWRSSVAGCWVRCMEYRKG